jgi:hypothetical protein
MWKNVMRRDEEQRNKNVGKNFFLEHKAQQHLYES